MLDRAQDAGLVVHGRVDDASMRIRRYDPRRSSMRIDMIRAILGVIFDDEYRGTAPQLAMRHAIHQRPDALVIVSHIRARSALSRRCSGGMIVTHSHYEQLGRVSL